MSSSTPAGGFLRAARIASLVGDAVARLKPRRPARAYSSASGSSRSPRIPDDRGAAACCPRRCGGGAKLLGPRPVLERFLVRPHRMGGIERVIVAIGPAQQVKLDKAGQLIEIGVPTEPAALELLLVAFDDFEAIHCDVHSSAPLRPVRGRLTFPRT